MVDVKVVQETTKEVAKKPGTITKILGAGGKILSNALVYLMPTSLDEPQPLDFQPKIDEKLQIDDKQVRTEEKRADRSPITRITDDADSFVVLDSDEDTGILLFEFGEDLIEIGGDFSFDGDTLTIDNFDMEGSSSNEVGIKGLKAIAKALGTELGVKTINVNGAPRTTGANPGKVTKLTFEIDKL